MQAESFSAYKNQEVQRLQKLLKCNPDAEPEAFYTCIDAINIVYEQNRKSLNEGLLIIDNQYEDKFKKCGAD